jgi:teichuronic acid biosynthesis glycosyltransferase TuaG
MISILIPLYNGIEFLEESVNSVINQTFPHWELLIGINGFSPNSNTYLKAKEYEKKSDKIRVFDFYYIKGKSSTLNELTKLCNYNYIALLDVDDIWFPKKLEIQSNLFKYNFDVIGSMCIWFGNKNGLIPKLPTGNISNYDFIQKNPMINSSCIIRKELCYWYEKDLEDYDLWLRLKNNGKKFFNCKKILVKHRIHNASAFNSIGNKNNVDKLLISHGYNSRSEINNYSGKISIPKINKVKKINMKIF